MARAAAALLREADLLVPVPLHRRRLLARRYNQSALAGPGARPRVRPGAVAVDALRADPPHPLPRRARPGGSGVPSWKGPSRCGLRGRAQVRPACAGGAGGRRADHGRHGAPPARHALLEGGCGLRVDVLVVSARGRCSRRRLVMIVMHRHCMELVIVCTGSMPVVPRIEVYTQALVSILHTRRWNLLKPRRACRIRGDRCAGRVGGTGCLHPAVGAGRRTDLRAADLHRRPACRRLRRPDGAGPRRQARPDAVRRHDPLSAPLQGRARVRRLVSRQRRPSTARPSAGQLLSCPVCGVTPMSGVR